MAVWPARLENRLSPAGGPSQHQACLREPADPLAQPGPLSSKAPGAPDASLPLHKSCCQAPSEVAVSAGGGRSSPFC